MLEHGLDQAAGLRRLMPDAEAGLLAFPLAADQPARWIAQLAHALRAQGRKPVVVDASRGTLAGAFGLKPRHDLIDLMEGRLTFDQVAQCTPDGIHVLRADRGVEAFVASGAPAAQLMSGFSRLSHGFDEVLLAMPAAELACLAEPAGRAPVVRLEAAGSQGVVTCYALVKELAEGFGFRRFACVVDGASSDAQAGEAHARLAETAQRFLGSDVELAGWLPASPRAGGDAAARIAQRLMRLAAPAYA